MSILTNIKRALGWLGFRYCQYCGRGLVFKYQQGYAGAEVWGCPHCDHLDRFEIDEAVKILKKDSVPLTGIARTTYSEPVKRGRGRPKGSKNKKGIKE